MPIPRVATVRLAILTLTVTACGSSTPGGSSASTLGAGATAPGTSIPAASASPRPSPSPSPTASPSVFRVVALALEADPAEHIGACPLEITFSARLPARGGNGTVSYRWVSSDGDTSPTKTVDVRDGAPMTVSSTWTVDRTTVPTHAGWSSIELVGPHSTTPDSVESARAEFAFTCDADDDVESIGFGIGGSDADCSIKTPGTTFAAADPIRMVATWRP